MSGFRRCAPVDLETARERLLAYRAQHGMGPHVPSTLAGVIWGEHTMTPQGAGAAATRVLKRLGCHWDYVGHVGGWMLVFKESAP